MTLARLWLFGFVFLTLAGASANAALAQDAAPASAAAQEAAASSDSHDDSNATDDTLRILRITPEGEDVSATRQIVIEFDRPVVPVGAMDRQDDEIGVTFEPALDCQWRWLNRSALACQLGQEGAMQPATRYTVKVAPEVSPRDKALLAAEQTHSFTTRRPVLDHVYLQTWLSPQRPQLRAFFNQPVTGASVRDHVFFEAGNRYHVGVARWKEDQEKPQFVQGEEARKIWIIEPDTDLPADTKATLMQESGLISSLGKEPSDGTRTVRAFHTFGDFTLAHINCRNAQGKAVEISAEKPQSPDDLCNPLQPVSLSFTAPVLRSQVSKHLSITPDLAAGRTDFNPWGTENRDWSRRGDQRTNAETLYTISLPIGLRAAQDYTVSAEQKPLNWWQKILSFLKFHTPETTSDLSDEFGRKLPPFSISFATGHRNPNFVLPYRDAVLEKNVDSDVPLYVNNLESYRFDYRALSVSGHYDSSTGDNDLPLVQDVQYARPLQIRDMLKGQSGAVYGFISTTPEASDKWEGANRLFAQVTPYQVHAKIGHFRSSVWVSDLETGAPVPDATISVYSGAMNDLRNPALSLGRAVTDENGMAWLAGTDTLDPDLAYKRSYRDEDARLFIRVDKGRDMALLPLTYDYEVQLWNIAADIYPLNAERHGHLKAWGMTAQGIYRTGDTVQYKIYLRDNDNQRLIAPPSGRYTLEIFNPMGQSVERRENVTLSRFGTIDGEYAVPRNAAVGWYSFQIEAGFTVNGEEKTRTLYPLSVLVSDFTPAPFRVSTELNGGQFEAGQTLTVETAASLHSGGAYADAAARVTATLHSRPFTASHPLAQGFQFSSYEDEQDRIQIYQQEGPLDAQGTRQDKIKLPAHPVVFGQLRVESAVRDDRGKTIANEARADYIGVNRLVGLKPRQWVYPAGRESFIDALVVDPAGTPVDKTPITLTIERQHVDSAQVKSAGNAYLNDDSVTWEKISSCNNISSAAEATPCAFTPPAAGTYRAIATVQDSKGRKHSTTQTLWVSGADYVQWDEGRENALSILPERTDYKVGERARYLVKNPYPGAKAYISIERYGVIDHFVQTFDTSTPVVEFEIKPDYLPGFYLSVVVMSPRVETPPPEIGQIDLGKPSFRMGYIRVPLTDPHKELTVTAQAGQDEYRPRDSVSVDFTVTAQDKERGKEPVELAIAVLDESVFDLIQAGRDAYDPYQGFYDLEPLDISNYSLLSRLIGRQKFEKKGANAGGDGGVDLSMRDLFRFVAYWNPSVPVDREGKARIAFEAPDNLTGWRVLALAATQNDLMGLGETSFKVNRPTELRPAMPNQVREGDDFTAGFTLMNRTGEERTLAVELNISGDYSQSHPAQATHSITLKPYERAEVGIPVKAAMLDLAELDSGDGTGGHIIIRAQAGDALDTDAMEHTLPVLPARQYDTAAQHGSTTQGRIAVPIAIPQNIHTDTGDLSLVLSPSLLGDLEGAFRYMRDYDYPCWEQKLSMAVMASHYTALRPYLDLEWNEAEKLPAQTLAEAAEFQAPNGGMAYFQPRDTYADPYLSAYTALAFRWMREAGHSVPASVEERLHSYLGELLKGRAMPDYYHEGMAASVRAMILYALHDTGKIKGEDILRFEKHLPQMSVMGQSYYSAAAQSFPDLETQAERARTLILAKSGDAHTAPLFSQSLDHGFARLLTSDMRDSCVAFDMLLSVASFSDVNDRAASMARAILRGREGRDRWLNTQENIFCTQALLHYARLYETDPVDLTVKAGYRGAALGDARFTSPRDMPETLRHPLTAQDPGTGGELSIERSGTGRLYYTARLRTAPLAPHDLVNAGLDVRREYSLWKNNRWQRLDENALMNIRRGDLVKIDLFVSLPGERSFVVVHDPLPGGLETVNRDLATASSVDEGKALFDEQGNSRWYQKDSWAGFGTSRWSFYHRELRHDSARFYADWLPAGDYHLSYTAQAVATGEFIAPAAQAEEMYNPEIYGRATQKTLKVDSAD